LISELSLENLVLYDAVTAFLKKFEFLDGEEKLNEIDIKEFESAYEHAYNLYFEFVQLDSPYNANVAYERRRQFSTFFARKIYAKDMHEMFELMKNLQWDIECLMRNDSFARFRFSPQYFEAIKQESLK
jgi:hypothetical protein